MYHYILLLGLFAIVTSLNLQHVSSFTFKGSSHTISAAAMILHAHYVHSCKIPLDSSPSYKTNEIHKFLKFIFGIELYMFRTSFLSIIRSLVLYIQQWYMLYRVC